MSEQKNGGQNDGKRPSDLPGSSTGADDKNEGQQSSGGGQNQNSDTSTGGRNERGHGHNR